MDALSGLLSPAVLAVSGILTTIAVAFMNCAIAHAVIVLSARLYESDPEKRAIFREAWTADFDEMKALERPANAGTLLWKGARTFARRQHAEREIAREQRRLVKGMAGTVGEMMRWIDSTLAAPGSVEAMEQETLWELQMSIDVVELALTIPGVATACSRVSPLPEWKLAIVADLARSNRSSDQEVGHDSPG